MRVKAKKVKVKKKSKNKLKSKSKSYQPSVESQGQLKCGRKVAKAGIDGVRYLMLIFLE